MHYLNLLAQQIQNIFFVTYKKIKNINARSLADVGFPELFSWLTHINTLGTANMIMSDGVDTIIYHDKQAFNQLYWFRSCPPHTKTYFESDIFSIELTSPFDIHHTFVLVANENISQHGQRLLPGQMLVLRRGKVIWNSLVDEGEKTESTEPPLIITDHYVIDSSIKSTQTKVPIITPYQVIDYVSDSERQFFSLIHETRYQYENLVELSKHLFHLHPINDHIQTTLDYKLQVSVPGYGEFFEDVFGNIATFYHTNFPHSEMIITTLSIVSIADNPSQGSEYLHKRRDIPLVWLPWQRQMSPYSLPFELPESELNELIDFAMSFVKRNDYDLMEVLNDINLTIYRDFNYVPGSSTIATTPYELYMTRRGVCQDFTNLFICLARLLNVPARYRIGYIHIPAQDSMTVQSEASHAWVEVYLPYIGWYGLIY